MNNSVLQKKIAGAWLALACGDALGAPAEFQSQAAVRAKWGILREMVGGGMWRAGEWTDDTAMALCVAEGILENPRDPVDAIGARFLKWFASKPKDVGNTIRGSLHNYRGNWAEASRNSPGALSGRAASNGSLMRTLPIALAYADRTEMLKVSARVSSMTHWDPQAEIGCAAYNIWISNVLNGAALRDAWYAAIQETRNIYQGRKLADDTVGPSPLPENFWARLETMESKKLEQLQPNGYAGYVVDCLEAAVWSALRTDSLEDALVTLVNLGGEADTMAAVCGGAVGAYYGMDAIPARWLDVLHERARLEKIGAQLAQLHLHARTYAKPALPSFEYSRIDSQLLAGRNPLSAHDVEILRAEGVTHILDLRYASEWTPPNLGQDALDEIQARGIIRKHIAIMDASAPTNEQLREAVEFIDSARADSAHQVYVHCRAGWQRTAAVLLAYDMQTRGCSFDESLRYLQARRRVLNPLPEQEIAVKKFFNPR